MRLYRSKIPTIAKDIIAQLTASQAIDVSQREEAELDIEAVLKEYLRFEREVTEHTKDMLEQRGLSHDQFGRVKRIVAERKGFGLGQEGINWICNQILETFMQSQHIDEIFSSDADLRRTIQEILRRHMMVDEELDREVRQRIRNMQEGTATWDVEYAKVMEQIKRKRGIKD